MNYQAINMGIKNVGSAMINLRSRFEGARLLDCINLSYLATLFLQPFMNKVKDAAHFVRIWQLQYGFLLELKSNIFEIYSDKEIKKS